MAEKRNSQPVKQLRPLKTMTDQGAGINCKSKLRSVLVRLDWWTSTASNWFPKPEANGSRLSNTNSIRPRRRQLREPESNNGPIPTAYSFEKSRFHSNRRWRRHLEGV